MSSTPGAGRPRAAATARSIDGTPAEPRGSRRARTAKWAARRTAFLLVWVRVLGVHLPDALPAVSYLQKTPEIGTPHRRQARPHPAGFFSILLLSNVITAVELLLDRDLISGVRAGRLAQVLRRESPQTLVNSS
jgi:hypothetical protein